MRPPSQAKALPGLALLFALATAPPGAGGQEPSIWNGAPVSELVERGRLTRTAHADDPDFRSYVADARGYLYFFLDREDTGERNLVKTDQIAVRLLWRAPDLFKQEIVGLRDEKRLPTNIRYHVDHLTVVPDEFGDVIRMGRGEEVSAVVHPLAPGSGALYDFRLADSVTISFGGLAEPVRVYEIQVRPRDLEREGFVGTVFLDRESAAVVRMSFTFTPASYVDPHLDYIRISLDNALWNQRHWLPYRQSVEIRREFPYLDLPAGSIIQGRWEIGGYDFDADLPVGRFAGPPVTAGGRTALARFPFERGLYDQVDTEGLASTPELDELETEIRQLVGSRYLSGLGRLRLLLPPVSDALRFNRVEGWVTGAGLRLQPAARVSVRATAAYAHGRDRPTARVTAHAGDEAGLGRTGVGLEAYVGSLRDVGPVPGASGVVNTLSAMLFDTDLLDPYFASGARTYTGRRIGPLQAHVAVRFERHRQARVVVATGSADPAWRPARPIDEGDLLALDLGVSTGSDERLRAEVDATLGRLDGRSHQSVEVRLSAARRWLGEEVELRSEIRAGAVSAHAPRQSLYLLGGRGTLPGYRYRSVVGDAFLLVRVEGSRALFGPWLRGRAFGSVGDTWLSRNEPPAEWSASPPPIALFSAGLGLGFAWDTVHLDFGRGLNGGHWEVSFAVNWRFRSML